MALGAGDVLRTTCNFTLGSGDQYQNVFHHIFDGVGGVSDAVVVADIATWASTMYEELRLVVENAVVEQLSSVDQVDWVVDAWEVIANIGTFTPGFTPASAATQLPNQTSPFVVFKTARPKTVGRKFLFPFEATQQDSGILAAGMITKLIAWADDAVNDIDIDVLNVLHPGVPRTAVNDWENFTVAVVTNLVGSQRRRRQGYGA